MPRVIAISVICFSLLASCGNKSESDQVDVYVIPTQPVVITSDFNIPGGQSVTAPWFSFNVEVANNSPDPVTVMSITVNVTATATGGGPPLTATANLSPSTNTITLNCNNATTVPLTFTSFGTIPAGSVQYLSLIYSGPALPADCDGISPNLSNPTFYVGGNPKVGGTGGATSYNYSVQVQPVGWFGTLTSPTGRFTKSIYITTQ